MSSQCIMSSKQANNNPGLYHFKGQNLVFAAELGPEINSRACLWGLPRSRLIAKCWLSIQCFVFLLIFCLDTPKGGSGPSDFWTEPSLGNPLANLFPYTSACPGTQYSPTVCQVEISFNAFWHCGTSIAHLHCHTFNKPRERESEGGGRGW